jgi:DNA-binding NarL/FixJ family response regulator
MRVLCADDHDTIRRGVCSILSDNFEELIFEEAKNGEEAVSLRSANRPDLVILDINMPILDGYGAARQIHELMSDVPILFFTMHTAGGLVSEARRLGVRGLVTKDTAGEMLVDAVRALLRHETYSPLNPVAGEVGEHSGAEVTLRPSLRQRCLAGHSPWNSDPFAFGCMPNSREIVTPDSTGSGPLSYFTADASLRFRDRRDHWIRGSTKPSLNLHLHRRDLAL